MTAGWCIRPTSRPPATAPVSGPTSLAGSSSTRRRASRSKKPCTQRFRSQSVGMRASSRGRKPGSTTAESAAYRRLAPQAFHPFGWRAFFFRRSTMSLRFKGSDLRPVLAEAVANQCRVVLAKDQGVYFLAEQGARRPDGRVKLLAYALGCNPATDRTAEGRGGKEGGGRGRNWG